MMWVIVTKGINEKTLFLIDRKATKRKWWSERLDQAMIFRKESAAIIQAKKLRYRNPEVISLLEAKRIAENQESKYLMNEEYRHPLDLED